MAHVLAMKDGRFRLRAVMLGFVEELLPVCEGEGNPAPRDW